MTKLLDWKLERFANLLVVVVLVGVPFHAFLTVFASTIVGHYTLLRLWDDIALLMLVVIVAFWVARESVLRTRLFASAIFRLVCLYVLLTLMLGFVALLRHRVNLEAFGYAAIVNLRFLGWFMAVNVVAERSGWLRAKWRPIIFWPILVVCVFALLQFFVLPAKFLAHFGYDSLKTVAPVTTINQATNTIRVQSFLRGPNPLGAYLVLGMGLLLSGVGSVLRGWRRWLLASLTVVTLALTFSRSAWIGATLVIIGVVLLKFKDNKTRVKVALATVLFIILAVGGTLALSRSIGVQDAFLHTTPESKVKYTSNQGHSIALRQGVEDVVREPFGRGPGTAGPASLYNYGHSPRNSENYFLEIGQEIGWAGLVLLVTIMAGVGVRLWYLRHDALALCLLVTLIGLTIVNQFAYAWTDDTLAFIWWGLAGIALARPSAKGDVADA